MALSTPGARAERPVATSSRGQLRCIRPSCLDGLWVRELRKLSESGHETAFLSTDYRAPAAVLARAMFGRWSQESMAYRAEAAMAQIVRQTTSRDDDARSLLRAVYSTEIDLIFDQKAKNPPTGHGLMTRP